MDCLKMGCLVILSIDFNQFKIVQLVSLCVGISDDHITSILKELHWIPAQQRIIFKILLITYKALNDLAPIYISNLLNKYVPIRQLRSSSQYLLNVPSSNLKTYGDRAFSVCAPKLWNDLPYEIKCSFSINSFKSKLKTYLFRKTFY